MTEHEDVLRNPVEFIALVLFFAVMVLFLLAWVLHSDIAGSVPLLTVIARAISVLTGVKSG